ncbi:MULTISPECIES: biotin transporter BioY [unclassified Bacillus (in: firmicutes)]|uniref:biotin transporter BioY n=1 Tax=unclassified Bacillus (in: firmicutes) TaxID=185979 RepID=UPI0008EEAC68|nr:MULTISPECIES: biotin transporter BioY [unclassified Bacillus (in: firmicutes)]SFB20215.1 biotin transport system substrate-specific component [Bacillus sp. UNCCL13]SFQ90836.1 biotin transport system substrate-specific component [Bacillus sp. cl95]
MSRKLKTIDLTLVGMFVALMAIGANITSFVPFMVVGGVPITLQTFFAILAGAMLGSRIGSLAMIVYALVGLVGVPVFAKFGGGFTSVLSPTFGFIVSFIFTAYVVGKIVEKKNGVGAYVIAALIGMAVNYLFGTNWMYFAFKHWASAPEGLTYKMVWSWMVVPLPKDIILAVLAGLMAHRLEKTVLSKGQFKHLKNAA